MCSYSCPLTASKIFFVQRIILFSYKNQFCLIKKNKQNKATVASLQLLILLCSVASSFSAYAVKPITLVSYFSENSVARGTVLQRKNCVVYFKSNITIRRLIKIKRGKDQGHYKNNVLVCLWYREMTTRLRKAYILLVKACSFFSCHLNSFNDDSSDL